MAVKESRPTTVRRAADALGSLLTALLVFAATPAVLSIIVGDPLAHGLGHQWDLTARVVLAGLALVAWVAWAACCIQVTRAVIDHVRRREVSVPAGALLSERLAVRMATGVLSIMALVSPVALSAGAGAGASSVEGAAATVGLDAPAAIPPSAVTVPPSVIATAPWAVTYVVRPGDSLWSIAQAELGDGGDWPAIAALNLGRTMPDGLRFVDPSRIYAGWILHMPETDADADAPPAAEAALPAASQPTDRPDPMLTETWAPRLLDGSPVRVPGQHPTVDAAPRADSPDPAGPARPNLPELAALGLGAIGCAALTRRARRLRLLRRATSDEHPPDPEPSSRAIDTGILLARFDEVPALRAFEAANYELARALSEAGQPSHTVRFRAVCVGAAGVDFWLVGPAQPAPAGFTLSPDAAVWHAPHDASPPRGAERPYLPIVVPVGDDSAGTWLVPLTRGSCLPLVGEAGGDLWRAIRPVQEAWSWGDMVLITEDPQLVRDEMQLQRDADGALPDASRILFFGDPALLPRSVAAEVAVITLAQAPASDVTVVVDHRAASIHPLGRTVRPHLMRGDTSSLVHELVATLPPAQRDSLRNVADGAVPAAGNHRVSPASRIHRGRAESSDAADGRLDDFSLPGPGTVEVKLLTPAPRIEGLSAALPANRARRGVELVSYLALHQGDEITSDRLRTRVLGSSEADAASKTLFNIATAARRALGADSDGAPLFPPGSRSGLYRVTEGVTVDVQRAATLAAVGSATEDPNRAIALLRAALDLVEGEPMANVLSGYAWWEAEGHGARVAAVLVNAATDLAALAVDAGRFELAQWGLSQARLVDPYSEAISRAAMQVAAAAGDADRLRREWRDCQRRMDELDPGSAPSPRTERLYGELAQSVLVGAASVLDDE